MRKRTSFPNAPAAILPPRIYIAGGGLERGLLSEALTMRADEVRNPTTRAFYGGLVDRMRMRGDYGEEFNESDENHDILALTPSLDCVALVEEVDREGAGPSSFLSMLHTAADVYYFRDHCASWYTSSQIVEVALAAFNGWTVVDQRGGRDDAMLSLYTAMGVPRLIHGLEDHVICRRLDITGAYCASLGFFLEHLAAQPSASLVAYCIGHVPVEVAAEWIRGFTSAGLIEPSIRASTLWWAAAHVGFAGLCGFVLTPAEMEDLHIVELAERTRDDRYMWRFLASQRPDRRILQLAVLRAADGTAREKLEVARFGSSVLGMVREEYLWMAAMASELVDVVDSCDESAVVAAFDFIVRAVEYCGRDAWEWALGEMGDRVLVVAAQGNRAGGWARRFLGISARWADEVK